MSAEFSIPEDVKELVNEIITRKKIQNISAIKYEPGSKTGDGYLSKTVAVDITHDQGIFCLFIKSALNVKSTDDMPVESLYQNEIYFYTEVCPTYIEFCKKKGVQDALRNIPICYSTKKNLVALEKVKARQFALWDRNQYMNDNHINLVLEAFARSHAIAYAFKDQERQKYDKLSENAYDFFSSVGNKPMFRKMTYNTIENFLSQLDSIKDRHILKIFDDDLKEKLVLSTISAKTTLNEYSILTHGDSHFNNMMFKYQDEEKENPSDIMLIDWQCIRPASPVFDLTYFLFAVASKEVLDNLSYYVKYYHEKLSEEIILLGSNPKILLPYEALESEWKKHSKFGFIMSFDLVKMILRSDADDIFDLETMNFQEAEKSGATWMPKIQKEEEFVDRMRLLAEYMINNDLF